MKKQPIIRDKTCEWCHTEFTTIFPRKRFCCDRCKYIAYKLASAAGQLMERKEAITYYGKSYDDPLRTYGRTKHRPMLRKIYNYCRANNTRTFTIPDLDAHANTAVSAQMMTSCRLSVARSVSKTGRKVIPDVGGRKVVEWKFLLPGAIDGVE